MSQHDSKLASIESISAHDLENVTGGGKFGLLWKGAKKLAKVAPFAVAANRIHNIWDRATD